MAEALIITPEGEERRPLTAEEQAQRDADAQAAADQAAADQQAQTDADAARKAWEDALASATTVAQIRDVLLGKGLPARAESRPTA